MRTVYPDSPAANFNEWAQHVVNELRRMKGNEISQAAEHSQQIRQEIAKNNLIIRKCERVHKDQEEEIVRAVDWLVGITLAALSTLLAFWLTGGLK